MATSKRVIGWRSDIVSSRIALALIGFITCNGRSQQVGNGDGLLGCYFDNRHLYGTPVTNRVEAQVNFDWGLGAPAGLTYPDEFSALPRGRRRRDGAIYGVTPPWEGRSKHFTKEFEAFFAGHVGESDLFRAAEASSFPLAATSLAFRLKATNLFTY